MVDHLDDIELGILKVGLVDESYMTHRLQHGGDPQRFPVRIWFTRRLNLYERAELVNHGLTLDVFDRDPMQAIVVTTPHSFAAEIETIHRELPAVAESARNAREAAEREDEHLAALVQKINLKINPQLQES